MNHTIRFSLSAALAFLALCGVTFAGTFSISGPLTDDASTGIDPLKTYSHAISGGDAASVNGVNLELINPTTTPANVNWTVSSTKLQVNNNPGGWNVGASGVTGPGLQDLLESFTYNQDGTVGSNQTFTLSGLTPGQSYETRLYMRKWDDSTAREQTATFTAGTQAADMITFFEDHPEFAPTNQPSRETAWYLSYAYTADAVGTLDIRFDIQDSLGGAQGVPGSFHMFGLTNEVIVPEPGTLVLAALGLLAGVGYFVSRRRGAKA